MKKKQTAPGGTEISVEEVEQTEKEKGTLFSTARLIFSSNSLIKHRNVIQFLNYFLEFSLYKSQRVRHH
jgi:hypothetical protein